MFEIVPGRGVLLHVPRCSNVGLLGAWVIIHFDEFAISAVLPEAFCLGRGSARGLESGGDLLDQILAHACFHWFVFCCTKDFLIGLIIVCENIDARIVVHMPYQFLDDFNKKKEGV